MVQGTFSIKSKKPNKEDNFENPGFSQTEEQPQTPPLIKRERLFYSGELSPDTRKFHITGGKNIMSFFSSAINTLQILVIALGAGLGAWGVINLLEGYGNDNPGAKSQGMKQLMAGGGIALVGATLIPLLSSLFS